ncbi:MAG: hypothetical protein H0W62_05445 [Chitinophagales bacterium]|nr:hypothetical protein [Chitinophagales bacterium]
MNYHNFFSPQLHSVEPIAKAGEAAALKVSLQQFLQLPLPCTRMLKGEKLQGARYRICIYVPCCPHIINENMTQVRIISSTSSPRSFTPLSL